MIRLIAVVFALAVATSAQAMAPAPQNFYKPCDLANQWYLHVDDTSSYPPTRPPQMCAME